MKAVAHPNIRSELDGTPECSTAGDSLDDVFSADPSGHFPRMQECTQEQYRARARAVAACNALSAKRVATAAVELAAREPASSRRAHVGYFLAGEGIAELAGRRGWRLPLSIRLALLPVTAKVYLYFLVLMSLSLLTAWTVLQLAWPIDEAYRYWLLVPLSITAFQPTFVWFCQFSWALGVPRRLPRMSLRGEIPAGCTTVVAVPALLTSEKTVDQLIDDIERRYLCNPLANLLFCLLTDFVDSPTEHHVADEMLLARAQSGMRRLIEAHGDRFCLMHRPRLYNTADDSWMGYERKRGKIEALNKYICTGNLSDFSTCMGGISQLQRCKYVILLDADMQLPPGSALALIEVSAHPLNHPVIDGSARRVVSGYGVLQPGIYQMPSTQSPSAYERLHTSIAQREEGALQPNLYQDLFGESAYWGKGIYEVRAFHECTSGRFPENSVLSHDLLESCYVRCGFVGDIQLPEQFPGSYAASALRKHRWVRGDWSLLQWLRPSVRTADGSIQHNPIPVLGRWRIAENILRLFIGPCALFLVSAAWLLSPRPVGATTLIVLLFLFPIVSGVLLGTWRYRYKGFVRSAWDSARVACVWVKPHFIYWTFIVHDSFVTLDAAVRASVRMIRRRRMLEWTPSTEVNQSSSRGPLGYYALMWVSPAYAAFILWVVSSSEHAAFVGILPVVASWLLAPLLAWWISLSPRNAH